METNPGRTTLAALFTFICKPIVFLLLVVTVIGSIRIPFLGFALFAAGLFGKAVALAWFDGAPCRRAAGPRISSGSWQCGRRHHWLDAVRGAGDRLHHLQGTRRAGPCIVVYTLLLAFRARRPPAPSHWHRPRRPCRGGASAAPASASPAGAEIPAADALRLRRPRPRCPSPSPIAPVLIRMLALLLDLILVAIVCGIISIPTHRGLLLILPPTAR